MIDISVTLGANLPIWPGSVGMRLEKVQRIEDGNDANVSKLTCDAHSGTHVDAPAHCIKDGNTVRQIPLGVLVGETLVVELSMETHILPSDLNKLEIPESTERLLLRTKNSRFWGDCGNKFQSNFVALTPESAKWVVDRGIKLLGVDYLSVQAFTDSTNQTHLTLLSADVVILEGLNLSQVTPGRYELICLPLKLDNAEAAPARAILRKL